MEFQDRISAYPGRYIMTAEDGSTSQVVLERADEPITPGTPLNAETFNAFLLCTESADHPGCYCRPIDDELEWLNPPMVEGVEYRTIEKHNGLPVYTKRVVFTEMPNAGQYKSIDIFPVEYRPISISGVLSHNIAAMNDSTYDQAFPVIDATNGTVKAILEINPLRYTLFPGRYTDTELVIRAVTDIGNATADCVVKYVKG